MDHVNVQLILATDFNRSLDGDGNFNWRMVFPFDYMPIEKKLVVKRKVHCTSTFNLPKRIL